MNYFLKMDRVGTETLAKSSGEYVLITSVGSVRIKDFTHVLLPSAR